MYPVKRHRGEPVVKSVKSSQVKSSQVKSSQEYKAHKAGQRKRNDKYGGKAA